MVCNRSILLLICCACAAVCRADSVRTLDGKVVDGVVKIDPRGGVTIAPRNGGTPVKVDFSQLLRARFDGSDNAADQGSGDLWQGTDIGKVGMAGSHKFAKGQVTIEAAGLDIKGAADSFRMVSQTMSGNGEVCARLTSAGQPRPRMLAGVMIRENADASCPFAAVLMERNGSVSFVIRTNPGADARVVASAAKERTPIWLRLVRKGDNFSAWRSTDSRMWSYLAEANFNPGVELLAGLAVTSREPAGMCAAVFEKPRVSPDEPPGANITALRSIKSDSAKLRKPPGPDRTVALNTVMVDGQVLQRGLIEKASCEIRYTISSKFDTLLGDVYLPDRGGRRGSVAFQIFADNDKLFDSGKVMGNDPPIPLNLNITGRKELRLVVINSSDHNGGFSSAEFRQIKLLTLSAARKVVKAQAAAISTVDGSVYGGVDVREVNKDKVTFFRGERRDLSVDASLVARIYLPGLTQEAIAKLPGNSTGVLMSSGDFYEGDIDRFADGKVMVSSVIFGPREFKISQEVSAILLRPFATDAKPADYIVQATDGSVFMADSLAGEAGKLALNDRHVGKLLIEPRSLREIRYGGDLLQWLADLRPRRVDASGARPAATGFLIDSTIFGPSLQLTGVTCDRGISLSAGSSVTYDLDGQYKSLLCLAGVPSNALPYAAAIFVVEADGKELFRSSPRTSLADPLPITIDTQRLKNITFRVEPEKGSEVPIVGLWGDPLLVKAVP